MTIFRNCVKIYVENADGLERKKENDMKKVIALLIIVALAISMCACGVGQTNSTTTKPIKDINQPSEGLVFELNEDGKSYSVVSNGKCYDDNIVIPDTYNGLPVTKIGDYAFYKCNYFSIIIPYTVLSIGKWAFAECESLKSIIIPNLVKSIGNSAFRSCTALTSVVISDSVKSIGNYAFYECGSLTNITIPNTVSKIVFWVIWKLP